MRVRGMAVVAGVVALGLVVTACSKKSDTTTGTSGTPASNANINFSACMVTDTGGIDDKSFNASAWAGMQGASSKANVSYVQSKAETDYIPNIQSLQQKKCNLIVTVGGLMGTATTNAATAAPEQKYAIVDSVGNKKNVQGLQFNTAQGAFLGGYLAAGYSKSGKVATYGGIKIPPVTIFMDGFAEGVAYYNQQKGKNVAVLGWDEAKQDGSFAASFTDQNKGQQLANNFLQQGADVQFPVAGGTGLGAAAAAKAAGGKAAVIWVDQDGYVSAEQYKDVFLSTVFKDIKTAVQKAVTDAADGKFSAVDTVGTLANGGTGLSPFHEYDSKVDAGLRAELDQVKADVISGKISIKSPAQPKG
jgi:basic membrane protein A